MLEAQRLQAAYADRLHILIGFETDFIRPSFAPRIHELAAPAHVDYYVGSVHHVHSLPIDYNRAMYDDAIARSSLAATEQGLWADYYDEQLGMLTALRPRVVGHFDLIRLLSDEPGRDPRAWTAVWERIVRNLEVVREQGGWLECNSAALRKGLAEPYPGRAIAEVWAGPFILAQGKLLTEYAGMGQDGWEIHNVGRQPRHRSRRYELLARNHIPGKPRRERGVDVPQDTASRDRRRV